MRNPFKVITYVKPAAANDDSAGWLVMQGNLFQEFADDRRRYGWRVALYNVKVMLFGGIPKVGQES